jgi:phosphate transport system permease protein
MNNEKNKILKEKIIEKIIFIFSMFSIFSLFLIIMILFRESLPSIKEIGLIEMIKGREWYPTDLENPSFGFFPLIYSSIYITILSLIFSIPLGLSLAIYISEIASEKIKSILKIIVELISMIPSVVFGFVGVSILVPFIQKTFNLPLGYCVLTASIVLALMATPIIATLCEDFLRMVPLNLREASTALGANKYQTITKIILPAASSGLFTAMILGAGRIIGETMVVLMLSGGSAMIPENVFDPARPITSAIASEMGEAVKGSIHYSALFAMGMILFIISIATSIIAEFLSKRYSLKLGKGR